MNTNTLSFADTLAQVTPQTAGKMKKNAVAQVKTRTEYETGKGALTNGTKRTLKMLERVFSLDEVSRLLCAASVDPAFLNREIHAGKRYNVKSVDKFIDVVIALTNGTKCSNEYNHIALQNLFKHDGVTFNNHDVQSMFCPDAPSDMKGKLVTKSRFVDMSTADTQTSSTMNALAMLGIVEMIDPHKKTTKYRLRGDSFTASRMREIYSQ